jgi:hypothetical protein
MSLASAALASVKVLEGVRVIEALIEAEGNVSAAARKLGVAAPDLRGLMRADSKLVAQAYEEVQQKLDKAEALLWEGLRHESLGVRLDAAMYVLRHSLAARRRGFGPIVGQHIDEATRAFRTKSGMR